MHMRSFNYSIYTKIFLLILFLTNHSFAADSTSLSFEKQNMKKKYISFSFGMGIKYSNNPSLINFIPLDVPNYITLPPANQVSTFSNGIEFFGGLEFQIKKNFSVKTEYSYYIKSIDVTSDVNYQYSYTSHQPLLMFNYIFAQSNSFIKFGLGGGYFLYNFTRKVISNETNYSSSGPAVKFEGTFNAQLGKSASTYLSGFIIKTFTSDLRDVNMNYLHSFNNQTVNLSSFGVGLRLGIEIYFF